MGPKPPEVSAVDCVLVIISLTFGVYNVRYTIIVIIGNPMLSSIEFISFNGILLRNVYNDAIPRHTGPEILKAIVFRMLVSKFSTKVDSTTLGTSSNR